MQKVTLSTGVVLELKTPSVWAIQAVQRQMAQDTPRPPVHFIEAKGREEPNESDPFYLAERSTHEQILTERLYDTVIATGTKPAILPDGFPNVESKLWQDTLEAIGIEVAEKGAARYIQWVKYIAAPAQEDLGALFSQLLTLMGTKEEDVSAAVAAFRGDTPRGADTGGAAARDDSDGDSVREAAPGASATVRRARGNDGQ